jgi:hypothetical protein
MPLETYIPSGVTFDGQAVDGPVQVTLYDADGPSPAGSLTAAHPLPAGSRGSLAFEGTRGGKLWSVTIERVKVTNQTPCGCEFTFPAPPRRQPIQGTDRT